MIRAGSEGRAAQPARATQPRPPRTTRGGSAARRRTRRLTSDCVLDRGWERGPEDGPLLGPVPAPPGGPDAALPLVRQGWRRGLGRGRALARLRTSRSLAFQSVCCTSLECPPSLPPPGRWPLTCSSAPPTQLSHSVKSRAARPRASIAPRPQEATSRSRTATPLPVAAGEGADHGDAGQGRQLRKQVPLPPGRPPRRDTCAVSRTAEPPGGP